MGFYECACSVFAKDSTIRMKWKNSSVIRISVEGVGLRDSEQYCDLKLVVVEKATKLSTRTCDDVLNYNPGDNAFIGISSILDINPIFQASNAQ
jgi:hypothetical protein